MSYCRCGDDSDVYVWSGNIFNITLCAGKPEVAEIMEKNNLEWMYHFSSGKETLSQLLKLSLLGLKIPNRAILRLQREMKS